MNNNHHIYIIIFFVCFVFARYPMEVVTQRNKKRAKYLYESKFAKKKKNKHNMADAVDQRPR